MRDRIKIRDFRNKSFFMIDNEYLNGYAKHLGVYCSAVYLSLCRHVDNETQECFPGMKLMAEENGISSKSVERAIKILEAWGLVKVTRSKKEDGTQAPNDYLLLDKSMWEDKPTDCETSGSRQTHSPKPTDSQDESRQTVVLHNNTHINNTHITKPTDLFSFDEFWNEYPRRRVDKDKCRIKFEKLPEETRKLIIEDVKNRKINDNKWIKDNMAYVPQTSTYLNNKKWLDDYEKVNKIISHDFRTK